MAKVIITIEDIKDEQVDIKFDFQPPAQKGNHTPAQEYAMLIAQAVAESRPEQVSVNGEEV